VSSCWRREGLRFIARKGIILQRPDLVKLNPRRGALRG